MRHHAVIFDLEYTAWQGSMARRWSAPGERTEIVQIGAVKVLADTLKIVDAFKAFVRPRVNPVLSEYFTRLTGITNDDIAREGVDFVLAYRAFLDFVGPATAWAFGRDDGIFVNNLKLYGWSGAMAVPPYGNVVPWFAAQGIDLKGKHACDVAEASGAVFEGRAHDALDDARSVCIGMRALIERGAPNPLLGETGP